MAQIEITLKRSVIGRPPAQRAIVKALGLGRINSSVTKPANEAITGMVTKIAHLVEVKEVK